MFRHFNKVLIREKKWLPMDFDKILKKTMNNSIPWQALAGTDPANFVTDAHPSGEGASLLGGSGGMLPRKILKCGTSEMRFLAFSEQYLTLNDGLKSKLF